VKKCVNSSLGCKILIAVQARKLFPFSDPKDYIIAIQMQAFSVLVIPEMAKECHADRQSLLSMQVFKLPALSEPENLFRWEGRCSCVLSSLPSVSAEFFVCWKCSSYMRDIMQLHAAVAVEECAFCYACFSEGPRKAEWAEKCQISLSIKKKVK